MIDLRDPTFIHCLDRRAVAMRYGMDVANELTAMGGNIALLQGLGAFGRDLVSQWDGYHRFDGGQIVDDGLLGMENARRQREIAFLETVVPDPVPWRGKPFVRPVKRWWQFWRSA